MEIEITATFAASHDERPDSFWAGVDEAQLHYYCFPGDIVFRAGDADFSTPAWGWVPVLDFAVTLVAIVTALEPGKQEVFEFTESEAWMRYRRIEDRVEISASYTDDAASVNHGELAMAAASFRNALSTELMAAYPGLGANDAFRAMIGGDDGRRPSGA